MAFTRSTVTSVADLVGQLDTWMGSNGWTTEHLDTSTTAATGGEWAMRRTSGATNIRFSASWDSENAGDELALYQYVDQNYIVGDRPWGQDNDSGNGFAGTTPDASIVLQRHVSLTTTPIQFWAFEDDDYTHIVVETSAGRYTHFGWGIFLKYGDWTGGEYCYGQFDVPGAFSSGIISIAGASYLLDGHFADNSGEGGPNNGAELLAATIHCESLPSQPASGQWAVSMGGNIATPRHTDFGQDRQMTPRDRVMFLDGLRAGGTIEGFSRTSAGTDISGFRAMWEIAPRYFDETNDDTYGPMGRMADVRGMNIINNEGGDEIVQGGDTWVVFPAERKFTGVGNDNSGYLGIAYKQVS